jgi:3-hydroxybutyryl-CoA dehydrogenase
MGPFELMDLIGIDVNFTATRSMFEATFGEPRYRPHQIQAQMVAQGALGRKTGRGFYIYDGQGSESRQQPSEVDRQPSSADSPASRPNDQISSLGSIHLVSGQWDSGLERIIREHGIEVVEEGGPEPDLVLITAGRGERLRDRLLALDANYAPGVRILCQCIDITLAEISSWLEHPEWIAGFDSLFFGTGSIATLVATRSTNEKMRIAAEDFSTALERNPVWIDDAPGLVLPRIVACLANEAGFAAGEGIASPETIDLAMRLGTNYPKGPLAWAEEIGYAQIVAILDHLFREYGEERYRVAPLLRRRARL